MPRAAGRQHFVDSAPFAEIALRHPPVKEYGIIRRMKNAMFLLAAVMAAAVSADAAAHAEMAHATAVAGNIIFLMWLVIPQIRRVAISPARRFQKTEIQLPTLTPNRGPSVLSPCSVR